MPRSGIAESYDNSIYNILRNYQTIFQSDCIILIPTSSVWGFQFAFLLANAWYYVSFGYSVPSGGRMVLICVYLMANDIQNLFTCWVTIWISSLNKCLLYPFHFFFEIVFIIALQEFFTFWTQILYQIYDVQMFLSHSFGLSFHFLYVFWEQEFLIYRSSFYLFFLVPYAFGIVSNKALPNSRLWRFTSMFSSKNSGFSSYI